MSTIKLPKTENITISESPIMIINNRNQKGYKTMHGFVPFGGIFISAYNELMHELDEAAEEMKKNPGTSYGISATFNYFGSLDLQDINDYIENGILSDKVKDKIINKTRTLPFRVGFYDNQPVLYYIGVEDELVIYDILMIKENDIKIKLCKDCGNAFFPNTKGVYCSKCKDTKIRNREKYQKLKNDKVRLTYTRLQQRIQKREGDTTPYRMLFEKLAKKDSLEWLEKWKQLDKKYQKVKQYCFEYDSQMSEPKWNKKISEQQINTINDFETWLNQCWENAQ